MVKASSKRRFASRGWQRCCLSPQRIYHPSLGLSLSKISPSLGLWLRKTATLLPISQRRSQAHRLCPTWQTRGNLELHLLSPNSASQPLWVLHNQLQLISWAASMTVLELSALQMLLHQTRIRICSYLRNQRSEDQSITNHSLLRILCCKHIHSQLQSQLPKSRRAIQSSTQYQFGYLLTTI